MDFSFQGGILASIEDPAEQAFIQSNVEIFHGSHSSFWIGLYRTHIGEEHNFYLLMTKKITVKWTLKNTPKPAYCCENVMWKTTDAIINGVICHRDMEVVG